MALPITQDQREDLEAKVIKEARRLQAEVNAGNLTRENLREIVEATGDGEPVLALQFLEAEGNNG